MTAWTNEELSRIAAADELRIAALREDGTLRPAVPIWVVRVGDDLDVRSVNGPTAAWYRGTQARPEGRIAAAGQEKEVRFVAADPARADAIDAAYRAKYRRYAASIVDHIVSAGARSATLQIVPR